MSTIEKDKIRVIVERSGIPVAVIISMDDLARYRRFENQHDADFSILAEMSEAFADQDDETIEREVNRAIAEVRAEHPIGGKRT